MQNLTETSKSIYKRVGKEHCLLQQSKHDISNAHCGPIHFHSSPGVMQGGIMLNTNYSSAKASYLLKLFSPIVDYGMNYDTLHYQFDKWVFSRCSKRSSVAHYHKADLKYFLQDVGEIPYAMHVAHLELIDHHRTLVQQGNCFTIAPRLWAHQWHYWVEEALMKSASNLDDCSVSETMVLLHNLK